MGAVVGTATAIVNNFNIFEVIAPLTLSGSYPGSAAGDPLDVSGIVASNSVPIFVDIQEIPPAGTLASGVVWRYAVGTTQANGALQAFVSGGSGAVLSNLGNVTYASVTAGHLVARIVFKKFL